MINAYSVCYLETIVCLIYHFRGLTRHDQMNNWITEAIVAHPFKLPVAAL